MFRKALYKAANVALSQPKRPFALQQRGKKMAEAKGTRHARTAVARKLATFLAERDRVSLGLSPADRKSHPYSNQHCSISRLQAATDVFMSALQGRDFVLICQFYGCADCASSDDADMAGRVRTSRTRTGEGMT